MGTAGYRLMPTPALNKPSPSKVILWGGTGQAIVVRPIIEASGAKVVAVFDDTPGLRSPFADVPIYQGWESFQHWLKSQDPTTLGFCVAIGNPHGRVRLRLHEQLIRARLAPVSVIHPSAIIAEDALIGAGVQIMAGVVINPRVRVGLQCIINTKASLDHEDVLEDGVEIAPGATLCGSVHVQSGAWVCAGATVLPRIKIGSDAVIGAGAVVTKDVPERTLVVGVPAKPVRTL